MMNYFRLIEPYLHGRLSPEEQQAFERQLVRNPALANEFTLHFSLVRVLLANPEYPFSGFKSLVRRPVQTRRKKLSWMWHACAIAVLSGLLLGMIF